MSKNLCSIILPFYNSAKFISSAVQSIANQTYQNFELILIDDGSSDNSLEMFRSLVQNWSQSIKIVQQENGGSYQARNKGLDLASGDYITFYDVDDLWEKNHLAECIYYLDKYQNVDIIYTNCRMIDLNNSDQVVHDSVFMQDGVNNKFLELHVDRIESLHLINDHRAVQFQILYGLFLGLQFSIFRNKVFQNYRFDYLSRNEAEDQLSTVKFLKMGYQIGYLTNIHGSYRLHNSNSSAANKHSKLERKIWIIQKTIEGYLKLSPILNIQEKFTLRKRVSEEYFWGLGYNLGVMFKDYKFAFSHYIIGIKYWPFNYKFYKSLMMLCLLMLFKRIKRS